MEVQIVKRKRARNFSRTLPPEIWLRIHRFATFVPNAFDKDVPDPFSYPPPLSQDEIQDEMRRSLRTKRSLVLVCKLWNELSTCFLYEAMYVGLMKTLRRIGAAIELKGRAMKEMGRWTRRLDIAIRDTGRDDHGVLQVGVLLPHFLRNLEFFIARKTDMQNLFCRKILMTLSVTSQTRLAVYDSIHEIHDGPESVVRTLEEFQLSEGDWETIYATNFWVYDFHKFQSLRRLHLLPSNIPHSTAVTTRRFVEPMVSPCLQFLYLYEQFPCYVDVRSAEPQTKTLPFHLAYCGSDAELVVEYIIRSPGLSSRITVFEWEMESTVQLGSFLDAVSERCPNLQNLVLSFRTWHQLTFGLAGVTLPRSIQRLGLRSHKREGKRSLMRRLCDVVSQAAETTKSLRVVRFMDRQAVRNLREVNPEAAHQLKSRLDAKIIRLEAFDGELL